jgi:hypothetical protein
MKQWIIFLKSAIHFINQIRPNKKKQKHEIRNLHHMNVIFE